MKYLLFTLFLIFATQYSFAQKEYIRDICFEQYEGERSTLLYHYKVTVDWARISDYNHYQLDEILYGDRFEVIYRKDLSGPFSMYYLKEVGSRHGYTYQVGLDILEELGVTIDCFERNETVIK